MKTIPINSEPVKTSAGIVSDFINAVQSERGSFQTNTVYAFGENALVRFFHAGRGRHGMDLFKRVVYGESKFSGTRVTSTGKRKNLGTVIL